MGAVEPQLLPVNPLSKQTILILAKEEVISALLGAMVELDGLGPVFPPADERPMAAIRRLRPDLLLLDCEHELLWDADAMRCISATGTRLLLFSAMRSQSEIEELAMRHRAAAFALPVSFHDFAERVDRALSEPPRQVMRALGA